MNFELEILPFWFQNLFMLFVIIIDFVFIFYFMYKKKYKVFIICVLWLFIFVLFFNSPFWKISKITLANDKLKLHYGILSFFKNRELNLPVNCKVDSYVSRFPYKKIFFISIDGYKSLNVTSREQERLKQLCNYIDHFQSR